MRYIISDIAAFSFLVCFVLFFLTYTTKLKNSWLFHIIFAIFSAVFALTQVTIVFMGTSPILSSIFAGFCIYTTYKSYKNYKTLSKDSKTKRKLKKTKNAITQKNNFTN